MKEDQNGLLTRPSPAIQEVLCRFGRQSLDAVAAILFRHTRTPSKCALKR